MKTCGRWAVIRNRQQTNSHCVGPRSSAAALANSITSSISVWKRHDKDAFISTKNRRLIHALAFQYVVEDASVDEYTRPPQKTHPQPGNDMHRICFLQPCQPGICHLIQAFRDSGVRHAQLHACCGVKSDRYLTPLPSSICVRPGKCCFLLLQGINFEIWWLRNTTHAKCTSPKGHDVR